MMQQLVAGHRCLWKSVHVESVDICGIQPEYFECFGDDDFLDEEGEELEELWLEIREIIRLVTYGIQDQLEELNAFSS